MKIQIWVLDVKDGDAIIVHLLREEKHFVMLIDGGHSGDADMIIQELHPILEKAGCRAPHLILCSHYDLDHIGGLQKIVNYYGKAIGQTLIHRTTQILQMADTIRQVPDEGKSVLPSDSDVLLSSDSGFMEDSSDENLLAVLEGIRQEADLLHLIEQQQIPCAEPVAGHYRNDEWKEIEIIGPTADYYRKLFPNHFDTTAYLREELLEMRGMSGEPESKKGQTSCEQLDSLPKARLTSTNLNSAIVKITVGNQIFLLTGDAGVESFKNVSDYQHVLKDIFWLKVPHHGSRNNINSEMITLMSPKEAAISGNRYIDDDVVGCLANSGARVRTTRDEKRHLLYEFDF